MTYGFFSIIFILFVILRTVILPFVSFFNNCFDFFLPVIVYLGFFRSFREGGPVVLLLGLLMDGLSGVNLGLHLSTYIWLYMMVCALRQLLQVKNVLMLSLIMAAGVMMENGILIIAENLLNPRLNVLKNVLAYSVVQVVWAVFLGPVIIICLKRFHDAWDSYLKNWTSWKNEG